MSQRNKLQKFAENLAAPNVFENFDTKNPQLIGQHGVEVDMKGKWNESYFKNNNPITLELACGRGEYTLDLARQYPDRNFIGVDIKGARIWKGSHIAQEEGLTNVAFLRTKIEIISQFFEKAEPKEIWITFPDPFLKKSKSNRRLTSSWFLSQYKKILPSGAIINLKTDSPELYEFTLEVLETEAEYEIIYQNFDIYKEPLIIPELETKTWYERSHLLDNRLIKFIQIRYQGA